MSQPMHTFFKILAIVFTMLFLWAAYLQLNDPDPYVWVIVYGTAALASLAFVLKRLHLLLASILSISYFIAGFSHWPDTYEGIAIKEVGLKNVEEGREALGLLISGVILLIYTLHLYFEKIKEK